MVVDTLVTLGCAAGQEEEQQEGQHHCRPCHCLEQQGDALSSRLLNPCRWQR